MKDVQLNLDMATAARVLAFLSGESPATTAASAPVQTQQYTPPVQQYAAPVQQFTAPVQQQPVQYAPPVQTAAPVQQQQFVAPTQQVAPQHNVKTCAAALQAYARATSAPAAKAKLAAFGVSAINALPPEAYDAFVASLV